MGGYLFESFPKLGVMGILREWRREWKLQVRV